MKYENTELLNHSIADDFDADEEQDRKTLTKMFNPLNNQNQGQPQTQNAPIINNSFNGFTINTNGNHIFSHNSNTINNSVLKSFENIHPTGLISTPIVSKKLSELFD
ncbi:MAG: hypothetical protein ACRC6T_00800 [Sarcina sp.]